MFTRDRIIHFELFDRRASRVINKLRERLRDGYAVDFQVRFLTSYGSTFNLQPNRLARISCLDSLFTLDAARVYRLLRPSTGEAGWNIQKPCSSCKFNDPR
jgi:hypothetical protein